MRGTQNKESKGSHLYLKGYHHGEDKLASNIYKLLPKAGIQTESHKK